jgi:transcription elongation GreA/GreB family factor
VIDPSGIKADKVTFGATVTVLTENEERKTYAIVGVDEINPGAGHISWRSPVARALMNARSGDSVTVQLPQGESQIEICSVEYKEIKIVV